MSELRTPTYSIEPDVFGFEFSGPDHFTDVMIDLSNSFPADIQLDGPHAKPDFTNADAIYDYTALMVSELYSSRSHAIPFASLAEAATHGRSVPVPFGGASTSWMARDEKWILQPTNVAGPFMESLLQQPAATALISGITARVAAIETGDGEYEIDTPVVLDAFRSGLEIAGLSGIASRNLDAMMRADEVIAYFDQNGEHDHSRLWNHSAREAMFNKEGAIFAATVAVSKALALQPNYGPEPIYAPDSLRGEVVGPDGPFKKRYFDSPGASPDAFRGLVLHLGFVDAATMASTDFNEELTLIGDTIDFELMMAGYELVETSVNASLN